MPIRQTLTRNSERTISHSSSAVALHSNVAAPCRWKWHKEEANYSSISLLHSATTLMMLPALRKSPLSLHILVIMIIILTVNHAEARHEASELITRWHTHVPPFSLLSLIITDSDVFLSHHHGLHFSTLTHLHKSSTARWHNKFDTRSGRFYRIICLWEGNHDHCITILLLCYLFEMTTFCFIIVFVNFLQSEKFLLSIGTVEMRPKKNESEWLVLFLFLSYYMNIFCFLFFWLETETDNWGNKQERNNSINRIIFPLKKAHIWNPETSILHSPPNTTISALAKRNHLPKEDTVLHV